MGTAAQIRIAGVGIVSPLGERAETNWAALAAGVRAPAREIAGFNAAAYVKRRYLRPLDDVTLRCIAMTGAAMQDAGIDPASVDPARVGVVVGSVYAGIGCIFDFKQACHEGRDTGYLGLSPLYFPGIVFNSLSGQPAIEYGYTGPNVVVNAGLASGLLAVIKGAEYIRAGKADIVVAGGAEMTHPFIRRKYLLARETPGVAALGPDFEPAEAVCLFVLHRADDARFAGRRGASIAGWRYGFFPGGPDGERIADAVAAVPAPGRIAAVVLDGFANSHLAAQEQSGLRRLLATNDPILLRNKENFGHTLGASGALNLFHALMFATERGRAGECVLVHALDPGGNFALLTLTMDETP